MVKSRISQLEDARRTKQLVRFTRRFEELPVRCHGPVLLIASFLPLLLTTGCIYALRPSNTPSHQKLVVQTASPAKCMVRVADANSFPVAADGRVTFDVPWLPRGCDIYVFGVFKIADGSSGNLPAIHVLREGKVVQKLSLTQLGKLPLDAEGYHILVLK